MQYPKLQRERSNTLLLITKSKHSDAMELKGKHYHFNDTKIFFLIHKGGEYESQIHIKFELKKACP